VKLLSVGLAKALWFIDVNEMNPKGKDPFIHLYPAFIEDYKFKNKPQPGEDFKDGIKFTGGEFSQADGTVITFNATVYSDGISIDTFSSTNSSEEILKDLLESLPDRGFSYDLDMVVRKAYLSQVNVRCSKRLAALSPRLVDFANKVSAAANGTSFSVGAFELWPDPSSFPKPATFSFQRKLGEPPTGERFWSQAPVQTHVHLELLNELENVLT
jgi:hypothetical protein